VAEVVVKARIHGRLKNAIGKVLEGHDCTTGEKVLAGTGLEGHDFSRAAGTGKSLRL
jgi:hypothetical protein